MKTLKISRNVIHKGVILKKDAVHEIEDEDAVRLLEGEHATEQKTANAVTGSPRKELMAKTVEELKEIVGFTNKEKPGAITLDLTKAKKEEIVTAILASAGYNAEASGS